MIAQVRETNVLLNLIKHQRPYVDKIYLSAKDPLESKYQLLINWRKKAGIKHEKSLKAFIDYSQTIDEVYENLEDYNPTQKGKVLIVFDDMIAGMEANKKICPIEIELFMRGRKLSTTLVFILQSYFKVPTRLNVTRCFTMKIPNKETTPANTIKWFA